jgi:hypothetical protein
MLLLQFWKIQYCISIPSIKIHRVGRYKVMHKETALSLPMKALVADPGGYISATDDVSGGVWYFSAPKKFMDRLKNKYGKVLKFSLKQSGTTNQFDADDLILEGGGLILHYDTENNPGINWTKYRVSLNASKWLKER